MIEYRGALTEVELIEVTGLRLRVLPGRGTFRDGLLWLALAFLLLAGLGYFSLPGGNLESLWWLPFALLCGAIWWRRHVQSVRAWRNSGAISGEHSGVVSDEGLVANTPVVDARIPWELFSCHLASRTGLVLFGGARQLVLAASQFQNEDAWRRAREIVARHVPAWKGSSLLRRSILWFLLVLVLFLAWHFAQIQK